METTWLIPQVPLGVENRENLEKRRVEQLEILQQYAESGNLKVALADAGRSIWSHYRWVKQDPAYAAAYHKVREYLGDKLEGAVFDRALNGVERITVKDGQEIINREYDPHREALMLKGLKPEVYARKEGSSISVVNQSGNGEPRAIRLVIDADATVSPAVESEGNPQP